jgi:DNA-binding transcriptional MocR family regulator
VAAVFEPVQPPTTFEETVERLGTAIRLGILGPGLRLPSERELAEQLGISRSDGSRIPGSRIPRRIAVPRRSTVSSNVVGGWTGSKTAATAASLGMAQPYTCAPRPTDRYSVGLRGAYGRA